MDLDRVIAAQEGVLSRAQATRAGLSPEAIRHRLESGRWSVLHPGVYYTLRTATTWRARAHAALLRAGAGSALAGAAAAYVWGWRESEPAIIEVAVPRHVRPGSMAGTRTSRRTRLARTERHGLAVTSPAGTALDLCNEHETWRDSWGLLAAVVASGHADVAALRVELARRSRVRHRAHLEVLLGLVGEGAESGLEAAFVVGVVERHGLPRPVLQVVDVEEGVRRDAVFDEYGLVAECDGTLGHGPADLAKDRRRDRRIAARGGVTMRFAWVETWFEACESARDLAEALTARGWTGTPRRCGRHCRL